MSVRLGYACINMTLAKQGITTTRTMIKKTFDTKGLPYVSSLVLQNVTDLYKILKWNVENGIYVYRMSSSMFPWVTEYELTELPDYDKISNILKQCGEYAIQNDIRLSFHPGQYCVLASPSDKVVDLTINELNKSAQIMDLMGLPKTPYSKINIHIGGVYGNKELALNRFCESFDKLIPSAKARLTVENDDKASMYSVEDLYFNVYLKTGIPIVFDYHHHKFCPGKLDEQSALLLAITTWPPSVKPCCHYSESKVSEKDMIINMLIEDEADASIIAEAIAENKKTKPQAHSDYIYEEINTYGYNIDIVIESKCKELAVLEYTKSSTQIFI
jgi:UV DNA damage endonuclease